MRGTFANVRLRNQLVPQAPRAARRCTSPSGEPMSIFDASSRYRPRGRAARW